MASVYQAHVDASGTGDPNLFVMAGYIATADVWEGFSKAWKERLDLVGMPYFKMSEMGVSPSALERVGFFYRLIEEHKINTAISCVVRVDELVKVVDSIDWPPFIRDPESAKNPYFQAFKWLITGLIQNQEKLKLAEPIDFIFDAESESGKIHAAWGDYKNSQSPEIQKMIGDEPVYKDDKKVMPLQAADLYAWWVRRWQLEDRENHLAELKFPWRVQRDISRFHIELTEQHFRDEIALMLKPDTLIPIIQRLGGARAPSALRYLDRQKYGLRLTSYPDPTSPLKIFRE